MMLMPVSNLTLEGPFLPALFPRKSLFLAGGKRDAGAKTLSFAHVRQSFCIASGHFRPS